MVHVCVSIQRCPGRLAAPIPFDVWVNTGLEMGAAVTASPNLATPRQPGHLGYLLLLLLPML